MEPAMAGSEDDLLAFTDENQADVAVGTLAPWHILIVDDDRDVHTATLFALDNVQILGRTLAFFHAYSSPDALAILGVEEDIAVILLDVVMERDDAGLQLVRAIRRDLGQSEPRIILRTGQPGYAPEIEAIRDYDINDYKTKSELTRAKLFTTLTAAIRSYDQIRTINNNRCGLDHIVQACGALIQLGGLAEFAAGVVLHVSRLLAVPPDGLVCIEEDTAETPNQATTDSVAGGAPAVGEHRPRYRVLASSGRFENLEGQRLAVLTDVAVQSALGETLAGRINRFDAAGVTLFFSPPAGRDMAVHVAIDRALDSAARQLLDVFSSAIGVCLANVALVSRLRQQAHYDALVGLPNRVHFVEAVDARISDDPLGSSSVGLVDIDHFAEINDALGHRYGDLLLKAVGGRLRESLAPSVLIARVAGDAFGVFGRESELPAEVLLGLFTRPLDVEGVAQTVSVTLGLARLSEVKGSGLDMLKAASIALNRAKVEQRGHFAYFSREMGVEIRDRVRLLGALRVAFAGEGLHLNYQPQVRLSDASPVGLEALLRWRDDEGRFVPPDRFVPLAEQSGLIVAIGDWVMHTACRKQRQLSDQGFPGLRMAINVSVVQFRQPLFLHMLDAALARSGADPSCIELEITESVAMLEADYMVGMFNAIKARGLQIAVDDFGTGFSSLSYLQRLSIDRLKIDRSFVHQMGLSADPADKAADTTDATGRADGKTIAAMVIDLGRNLGLTVIAEGVEDEAQAARLHRLGCHEAQGYYYGRPLDEALLDDWLNRHRGHFGLIKNQ